MNDEQMAGGRSHEAVYCVIDPAPTNRLKRAYWQRVGVAFENRDGSKSVLLNALPTNGRLVIRREPSLDRMAREMDPKDFQAA